MEFGAVKIQNLSPHAEGRVPHWLTLLPPPNSFRWAFTNISKNHFPVNYWRRKVVEISMRRPKLDDGLTSWLTSTHHQKSCMCGCQSSKVLSWNHMFMMSPEQWFVKSLLVFFGSLAHFCPKQSPLQDMKFHHRHFSIRETTTLVEEIQYCPKKLLLVHHFLHSSLTNF